MWICAQVVTRGEFTTLSLHTCICICICIYIEYKYVRGQHQGESLPHWCFIFVFVFVFILIVNMRSAGSYKGRVYHIGPWREVDRSSAHLFHTTYIPILAHRHLAYSFFVWSLPIFLQCIPAVRYSYLASIGPKRRTLTSFWLLYMLFMPNVLLKV